MFSVWLFMRFPIFVIALTAALAQSPVTLKEFDVVSVKPSAPDEHNSFMFQRLAGGTVRMVGVPIRMLIMQAYDVEAFQISGGPDWIRTDRWDILAKVEGVEGRLTRVQENTMLQALMVDRFQLRVHSETKEMPVYALVAEKNKSKLKPPTGTEQSVRSGNGSFKVTKGRIAVLTTMLSMGLGRVVIDKTDLNGEYDFALEWTPDPGEGGPESIGLPPEAPRPHMETNGASIFTALQEQLGLRLVSQKGPVEMVVIDSVQRPTAN
jgi:bla regulator protein blaR1